MYMYGYTFMFDHQNVLSHFLSITFNQPLTWVTNMYMYHNIHNRRCTITKTSIAQPQHVVYTVQVSVPSPYLQTGRRSKEHGYFFLGYTRGRGWNRDRDWSRGGGGECGLGNWGGGGRDVSAMVLSSVGLEGGHRLVAALAHCIE